jgi:HSP20 family protein
MTQLTKLGTSSFNEFFNDLTSPAYLIRPFLNKLMADDIRIEVKEEADIYIVEAELPGVEKEDIKISLDGSFLTISAEVKKSTQKAEDEKVFCSERFYGSMSRGLQLPANIDQSKCNAKYQNGVLRLELPKVRNGSAKLIEVR